MKYEKPEIWAVGQAHQTVRNTMQKGPSLSSDGSPNRVTIAAYEADE
jgi:hypothetical protein